MRISPLVSPSPSSIKIWIYRAILKCSSHSWAVLVACMANPGWFCPLFGSCWVLTEVTWLGTLFNAEVMWDTRSCDQHTFGFGSPKYSAIIECLHLKGGWSTNDSRWQEPLIDLLWFFTVLYKNFKAFLCSLFNCGNEFIRFLHGREQQTWGESNDKEIKTTLAFFPASLFSRNTSSSRSNLRKERFKPSNTQSYHMIKKQDLLRVVESTKGLLSISPSSPRLLVVSLYWLWQGPVGYKPLGEREVL